MSDAEPECKESILFSGSNDSRSTSFGHDRADIYILLHIVIAVKEKLMERLRMVTVRGSPRFWSSCRVRYLLQPFTNYLKVYQPGFGIHHTRMHITV